MKRSYTSMLVLVICFFVILLVSAGCSDTTVNKASGKPGSSQLLKKSGKNLIIDTDTYTVTMSGDAEIIGIENKLTNEVYTGQSIKGPSGGIIGTGNMQFRICQRKSFEILSQNDARFTFQFAEGKAYVDVRVDGDTQDLVIAVSGEASAAGVQAGQFGIHNLSIDKGSLIVPSNSGIELTRDTFKSQTISWPSGWEWELQMAVFEGQSGGFWFWSTDDSARFKSLELQKLSDGIFAVGLRHYNNAPFSDYSTLEPIEWKLNVYEGGWQVPAQMYRAQLEDTYSPELFAGSADWINEISLVVNTPVDTRFLMVLKECVNPENTLLYVPQWRTNGYDINYPDYHVSEAAKRFISKAKELGFRIMLHTNFNGASPAHPLYKDLEPYITREPNSGSQMGWYLHSDAPYRHAYINPGAEVYRKVYVAALKAIYEEYGIDAFHLDASLVNINDRNGLINGLNYPQGNMQLHRELREAMPGVIFAGEGLNEINFGVSSLAQVRYTPSDTIILRPSVPETAHPITSFVLMPYSRYYGYLGTQHPESIAYIRNMTAYELKGNVPSFTGNFNGQAYALRLEDFMSPRPFTQMLLAQANFMAQNNAVPDLSVIYDGDTVYQYKIDDGIARIEQTDDGVRMYARRDDNSMENVFFRISGANRVTFDDITIPGWVLYNEDEVFGLDPDKMYAAIGKGYLLIDEKGTFRITDLDENVAISELRANDRRFILKLKGLQGKSDFQATLVSEVPIHFLSDVEIEPLESEQGRYTYRISGGLPGVLSGVLGDETVFEGEESQLARYPYISGAIADISGINERLGPPARVELMSVVAEDELKDMIFAQPSTDSKTFVDFVAKVSEEGGVFKTDFGIQENRAKATVEFLVEINGKEILRELASVGEGWKSQEVDLGEYKGQTVIVSLITTCIEPGITEQIPENGSYAVWIEPGIY